MNKAPKELPSISDAEMEILRVLWNESPLSAASVVSQLQQSKTSHPKTVKTLINRLLTKNAIGFHEEGRKYHYFPIIDKTDFYTEKTHNFLDRFFDGELTPLVSFFSEKNKLSDKDLKELKLLIESIEVEDDR